MPVWLQLLHMNFILIAFEISEVVLLLSLVGLPRPLALPLRLPLPPTFSSFHSHSQSLPAAWISPFLYLLSGIIES